MDRFNNILMYFRLDRDPIYRDGSSSSDVTIDGYRFNDRSFFKSEIKSQNLDDL